jgi:hypothetical protein
MPAKFDIPLKRSPKSDPQQYRVYRMENEAIGARTYQRMPWGVIKRFISAVCTNYHVPMPNLVRKDLGKWAAEWSVDEHGVTQIALSTKKARSQDTITITHELAHHLHCWLGGKASQGQQSHGPEFMACHMSILDTCRVIPVVGMRAICKAWGVHYVDPGTRQSLPRLRAICKGLA